MTFIYEEHDEVEGWTSQGTFKTLRGATTRGCTRLKSYGYLHADRYEGELPWRRHIVAEWKNAWGKVVARVWC